MNQNEDTQEARELMRRAQEELTNDGNNRITAEFLWGAFAHCLITIALTEGLPHDSHGAFQRIAHHMDATRDRNDWRSRFGSAERLHQHFYHGDLTTDLLRSHRRITEYGTLELLRTL